MKQITPALPPADLLPVGRHASLAFRALRVVLTPVLLALFRIRIEGTELVPAAGAYVIAANHLGWLDSFLVLMAFPTEPRVHFLGAIHGLVRRPVQWRVVRAVGGYIPVDMERHGDRRLYQHVERCLAAGGVAAFYPEARYGIEGSLGEFRKGFAHFAVNAGVPVVPVAISGTGALWLRREVRLTIGSPIEGKQVDAVVLAARARVSALIAASPAASGPRHRLLASSLTKLL
ncbi:MAG: hypothetical protein QOE92_1754 [Chloroflexota bacterium]|jgi:1-acyl-sn-glycerol-3-phosphate acyltransferase|nr:hypothetical protein [Chloroflexota bacterium]